MLAYVGVIALTRVTFGAHFPIDVAVGALLGWQLGVFSGALLGTAGLLPARPLEASLVPAEAVPLVGATQSHGA